MGNILPLSFLTKAQRLEFLRAAEAKAIERAIAKNVAATKGMTPAEARPLLNLRQVFLGVTTAEIEDFAVLTGARAAQESWGQDAADLTVDVFSSILAAAEKLNEDQACVFYGFIDLSSVPMLTSVRFKRGPDTLDTWEVEHCYGQGENGGLAERLIVFDPKDKMDIEMNFRSGDHDQHVVLFNIVAEPYGLTTSSPKS